MVKTCDLHTHSVYSDGTYTPTELIDEAVRIGLSAIALTDHNTFGGINEFFGAAEGKDIEAIAGTEISVSYGGRELHLLGLFVPEESFGRVDAFLVDVNRAKDERHMELVESLRGAGIDIYYEEILKRSPVGQINRAHIAAEMTDKGYVGSIKEAFDRYLLSSCGYYNDPPLPDFFSALDFIRSVGAVPVLAHPLLNLSEDELGELLPLAREAGLVGMECIYSTYNEHRTQLSLELARKNGICVSGGSDFHGAHKPDISLGTGRGGLCVPYELVDVLRRK